MWSLQSKGPKKVTWIDIVRPSVKDVEALKKVHNFHAVILEELLHPSDRAKVDFDRNYLYLIYHAPIYDPELRTSRRGEIDFLITKTHVITIRYEAIEPIEGFKQRLIGSTDLRNHVFRSTLHTTYQIIEEILKFSHRQLRHIESNVEHISKDIFAGREREMLEKISYAKRDILDYSIISEPQAITLESFQEVANQFWGAAAKIYTSDLVGDNRRILRRLKSYGATIESLEATNGQLLSASINLVIQRFTILAFLTFPLALFFAALATEHIGGFILKTPFRFWGIFLTLLITEMLIVYFSKKKRYY